MNLIRRLQESKFLLVFLLDKIIRSIYKLVNIEKTEVDWSVDILDESNTVT